MVTPLKFHVSERSHICVKTDQDKFHDNVVSYSGNSPSHLTAAFTVTDSGGFNSGTPHDHYIAP
jgi:hypothetical protein